LVAKGAICEGLKIHFVNQRITKEGDRLQIVLNYNGMTRARVCAKLGI
jgi:hypothetical protein